MNFCFYNFNILSLTEMGKEISKIAQQIKQAISQILCSFQDGSNEVIIIVIGNNATSKTLNNS